VHPFTTDATPVKIYETYVDPHSPCQQVTARTYQTPQHLYLGFQPSGLPQFSPMEALAHGTLWPVFANAYFGKREARP
jgi:spore coat protein JA